MEQKFTVSIFTENEVGLLQRVSGIFTRRHINIESITSSNSEIENVHRYTIVICEELDLVKKLVLQLEKQVDVYKAFYHIEEDTIFQEVALFKLATNILESGMRLEKILRENHARILSIEKEFLIIEQTGQEHEINTLFKKLKSFDILEFARSGRVAITKPMKTVQKYIEDLQLEKAEDS